MKTFKVAVYDEEKRFLSAIYALKEKDIDIYDVFTPYPVHEVFHLLNRKSRLPVGAYFLGLFAIIGVLAFLYYTSVIDWPIVYGGKPFNSFPSFIVVTIVLTIFTVTIGSLAIFSIRANLVPGRENTIFDERATDNKFIIVLSSDDLNNEKLKQSEIILKDQGATGVSDKVYEKVNA